jgi:glutaredoxin
MKLILYHFDGCHYCKNVESAINRLGIRDKIEHRDILKETKYRNELIALNGIKQVPCLVVDGNPMLESRDIIQFLEKTFG